ncbi:MULTISPECIES: tyrosine-type recombinase/integrase [Vibrio]|uniref:tyrosine-type recombinase/integrase n=1 Tax=Vibrio TaxID=662 RepID=UPI001376E848|nr:MULTISPECIES: tyrosine-type recombinase/integrase [Vibrio]MDK9731596.1 tyrosine-type recombinase/integrase [Vibrio sp. B511a]EGQ7764610.1 tyrosine-type recombinase/integrase [Vibrio alginolyticus]EGQ7905439.1 tyrosine-type recombinase/integrase [Vibrio alginolyticus]EJU9973944.1 tyrosine-type recombinase/integrase [Vibrio alginolyticus]ELA6641630.1 tyrosine-type recombinase/integrase [Vibrio alginolyticus]
MIALDSNMKVMPILTLYLRKSLIKDKLSSATVSKQFDIIKLFVKHRVEVAEEAILNEEQILVLSSEFEIRKYLDYKTNVKGLSSVTVSNYDAQLRRFYAFLYTNNFIITDPYVNGPLAVKRKSNIVDSCSFDELFELISATKNERERALLQFIYDSGLRVSEVPRVTLEDIQQCTERTYESIKKSSDNFAASDYVPLSVRGSKSREQGGWKYRTTRISLPTLNRIKKYHSSPLYKRNIRSFKGIASIPAFLDSEGRPLTKSGISKLFERLSKRARAKGTLNRMITPHKLRHGFAYAVLQSNDDNTQYLDRLVQVQLMLGHTSLKTTQDAYTSIPMEIYREMVDDNGESITRAMMMERLCKKTQLKIKVQDKK